jgi:hypothetical protein
MNTHLHYIIARHRSAEVQRSARRLRLAHEVQAARRKSPDSHPAASGGAQPAPRTAIVTTALEVGPAVGSER